MLLEEREVGLWECNAQVDNQIPRSLLSLRPSSGNVNGLLDLEAMLARWSRKREGREAEQDPAQWHDLHRGLCAICRTADWVEGLREPHNVHQVLCADFIPFNTSKHDGTVQCASQSERTCAKRGFQRQIRMRDGS